MNVCIKSCETPFMVVVIFTNITSRESRLSCSGKGKSIVGVSLEAIKARKPSSGFITGV